jgi:hypothetical protein
MTAVIASWNPIRRAYLESKSCVTLLTTSRSHACAGWLSSRRGQIMAASIGLGERFSSIDWLKLDRSLETLGPAALAGFLYDFPAGEIASVVVAQILGFPEAQLPAVAVNEIAVLALPNPSVIIRALREAMPRIRSELAV